MTRLITTFAVAALLGGCGTTSGAVGQEAEGLSALPVERETESSVELEARAASRAGFCDKHDVKRPVRRGVDAINACYSAQLKHHPGLSGRVEVTWTIGKDGRVTEISTTGPEVLGACVSSVIKTIRFRPPLIGCEVVSGYPMVFHAK